MFGNKVSKPQKIKNSYKHRNFVRFIYYFFKISGLATIQLIDTSPNSNKIPFWDIKKSKLDIFYNVPLILIIILTSIPGIRFMIQTGYVGRFQEEVMLMAIMDVSCVSSTIFILVMFCVRQEKIIFIINKLNNAIELSTVINEKKFPNYSGIVKRVSFGMVITIILLIFLVLTALRHHFNIFISIFAITKVLQYLVYTSVFLQYSTILECMRNIFKLINNNLKRLSIPANHGPNKISKIEIKVDISIQLYNLLSEISEELSSFYSLTMMWCIPNLFSSLFKSLYVGIKQIILLKKTTTIYSMMFDLIQFYFNLFPLPILAISVSNTVKEVSF